MRGRGVTRVGIGEKMFSVKLKKTQKLQNIKNSFEILWR